MFVKIANTGPHITVDSDRSRIAEAEVSVRNSKQDFVFAFSFLFQSILSHIKIEKNTKISMCTM